MQVSVELDEIPQEITTGRLTVHATPANARIELLNGPSYTPDLVLEKGRYQVRISGTGYISQTKTVVITANVPSDLTITLEKEITTGTLTIAPNPADARVKILNIIPRYHNNMELEAGRYHVEVFKTGYKTLQQWVTLGAGDTMHLELKLEEEKPEIPQIGDLYTDSTTGMEFVYVPGGCYQMGYTFGDGDPDEMPVHKVCVDSFYMGKYEVTQGEYQKIIGSNPSRFKKGSNYPVEKVSWNDSQSFIRTLNSRSEKTYRLPTEAEWEYAARSGGKKEKYAGSNSVDSVAWYKANSGSSTHQAGGKSANGLGLYDMSGNVWEWCSDWYGKNYYGSSPRNNPEGPSSGSDRVIRSGSWSNDARYARSAYRNFNPPGYRNFILGFRLVFSPGPVK